MRHRLIVLVVVGLAAAIGGGCATQRCMEGYGAMAAGQVVRRDGEILTKLVEHRRAAAQALADAGEQSSAAADLQRSVQAWEMAMAIVVQLQNLARREEHAAALGEHRELTSKIRCLATAWSDRTGHVIGAGDGMTMLRYQRELEAIFGDQGRPTDSQLTAIAEGREIYMGPVEEEVDVPDAEEGTGPSAAGEGASGGTPGEGGSEPAGPAPTGDAPAGDEAPAEGGEGSSVSVDDLLGE